MLDFYIFSKQLDELRASKESELDQLRDQVNRLQIQLNHGHSGFSEFKEKKAVEIRGLQNEIQKLKEQVNVVKYPDVDFLSYTVHKGPVIQHVKVWDNETSLASFSDSLLW